jgi:hypothetical protein
LLLPGRGLAGGGISPDFENRIYTNLEEWDAHTARCAEQYLPGTDPLVASCQVDIRPEPYVADFAAAGRRLVLSEAIANAAEVPPWWHLASEISTSATAPAEMDSALSALRHACNEENAA